MSQNRLLEVENKLKIENTKLNLLYKVLSEINLANNIKSICEISVKLFKKLGYDNSTIYLYNTNTNELDKFCMDTQENKSYNKLSIELSQKFRDIYLVLTKRKPGIFPSSFYSKNYSLEEIKKLDLEDVNECALIPLISFNNIIGLISLDNRVSRKKINKTELEFLMTFANALASSISNTLLKDSNNRQLSRLSAMFNVSHSLYTAENLNQVMNLILYELSNTTKADIATLTLLGEEKKVLYPGAFYNPKYNIPVRDTPFSITNSFTGKVLLKEHPIFVSNINDEPLLKDNKTLKKSKIKSVFSIPLQIDNEKVGVINLYSKDGNEYSDSDKELILALTQQASMVIKTSRLYQKIKKDKDNLTDLILLTQTITSTFNVDKLLQIVFQKVISLTNTNYASVFLYKNDRLHLKLFKGHKYLKSGKTHPNTRGIIGWVARNKKILIVSNVEREPLYKKVYDDTKSEACIPFISRGKLIGVLNLESTQYNNYFKYRNFIGLFTNIITIALENAMWYQEISKFNETLKHEVLEATKELRRKNQELKKIDKLKSEFVSNVSHELRTPLTSIRGYSSLLYHNKIGKLDEDQLKCVEVIMDESERLTRLINDVLDLSKLEEGRVEYKMVNVNIVNVAENAIKSLLTQAIKKNIKIKIKAPNNLSEIKASQDLLMQVFINLIGNAIKFSNENQEINIEIIEDPKDIIVKVIDNGLGIEKDKIPKLFDKFYQVDSSITRKYGGTGLGLPICKHIILAHKGHINVESEIDKGSTFSFNIPKNLKELSI